MGINEKVLLQFVFLLNRKYPELAIHEQFQSFSDSYKENKIENENLKKSFLEKNNETN